MCLVRNQVHLTRKTSQSVTYTRFKQNRGFTQSVGLRLYLWLDRFHSLNVLSTVSFRSSDTVHKISVLIKGSAKLKMV